MSNRIDHIQANSDAVFDAALDAGFLSVQLDHPMYVGNWMYMYHTEADTALFKHKDTRAYRAFRLADLPATKDPIKSLLLRCCLLGVFTAVFMAGFIEVAPSEAADLGVHGSIWPITEANLLDRITQELSKAERDGRLAAFNSNVKGQVMTAFTAPPPLLLTRATKASNRYFDPSITAQRDIRDHKGTLIVARGTRVNPLERLGLITVLIFVDGRDQAQLDFALGYPKPAKIILTGGNPQHLMETHQRPLFYDQKALLTRHFHIKALPSVITQDGLQLRVDEIVVEGEQ